VKDKHRFIAAVRASRSNVSSANLLCVSCKVPSANEADGAWAKGVDGGMSLFDDAKSTFRRRRVVGQEHLFQTRQPQSLSHRADPRNKHFCPESTLHGPAYNFPYPLRPIGTYVYPTPQHDCSNLTCVGYVARASLVVDGVAGFHSKDEMLWKYLGVVEIDV
jgi:hypothetical protein